MPILVIAFAGMTALCAAAFVAVAVLWLRKLRETVSKALAESAEQQLATAKKLGEAIANVQKQQRTYEQQLRGVAEASLKLRQDLTAVSTRIEHSEAMQGDRTVH